MTSVEVDSAAMRAMSSFRNLKRQGQLPGWARPSPYEFARYSSTPVAQYIGIPCLNEPPQWKNYYCPGGFDCSSIVPSFVQNASIQPRIVSSVLDPVNEGVRVYSAVVIFRCQGRSPTRVEAFVKNAPGKANCSVPVRLDSTNWRSNTWMCTVTVTNCFSALWVEWNPFTLQFYVEDHRGNTATKMFEVGVVTGMPPTDAEVLEQENMGMPPTD